MNNKTGFMMIALVLVAGCNRGGTGNEAGNSSNSAAAAAGGPSGEAAGAPVTQASLVGTWGQDGCTNSMTFGADGTATSTSAQQGNNRWSLDGSTIVITSPGQPDVRMPATINGDTLQLRDDNGASTALARCETEAGEEASQKE
jgi:hypothetical protein